MTLIEWKQQYALGIPEVDHEHRELVELINELHTELQRSGASAPVGEFLGELYAQISAHFALEEKIMVERRYDEYRDHKDDHERLLDGIRDLMDAHDDGNYVDLEIFSSDLEQWFGAHFRTKDARLHTHLDKGKI